MHASIVYRTIKFSFYPSILTIQPDGAIKYLQYDNAFDTRQYPGTFYGKIPNELIFNIKTILNKMDFNADQQVHGGLQQFISTIHIVSGEKLLELQPYPDQDHLALRREYEEIEKYFYECIQIAKQDGSSFAFKLEGNVILLDDSLLQFTIKVTNVGNTSVHVKNVFNQHEYASAYGEKTGIGPIYNYDNVVIIKSTVNIHEQDMELLPNIPAELIFRTKESLNNDTWTFSFGTFHIFELAKEDSEVILYTINADTVTEAI